MFGKYRNWIMVLSFISCLNLSCLLPSKTGSDLEKEVEKSVNTEQADTVKKETKKHPENIEIMKDFWKYIFTELDTNHYVVYNIHTYHKISKNGIDEFSKKEARDIVCSLDVDYDPGDFKIKKGLKERINGAFKRLKKYKPTIVKELKKKDLDTNFAVLPILESLADIHAESKCGAVGLYQFMEGTAKGYGLIVNKYIDQRRDGFIAAEAFASYMEKLMDTFDGRKGLALTSYNFGEYGMKRLMKKVAKGGNTGFITIGDVLGSMPGFASKNFYASYLAVLECYDKSDKTPLEKSDSVAVLMISHDCKISEIMNYTEMSKEEVKKFNTSYMDSLFIDDAKVDSGTVFRLPIEKVPSVDMTK